VGDPATPGLAPSGAATDLPELAYRQVPAVVQGFEAQASRRLALGERGTLELQVRADAVRATDLDSGRPLPRIPPLRLGLGAAWQRERWLVRAELLHVRGQFRTAPNELPTDGYTFLDAFASWRVSPGARSLEAFVRGTNLLDVEARVHASPIKDVAPLPGRGFLLGLRGTL
jgi:iron complex outermembrane receptor protein